AAHRAGAGLAAASYGGERGHPVLLAREHWAGVARAADGDRGARAYLRAHADAVTLVECADVADPRDVDVPDDLGLLSRPD
ncbi:nucleotidyltransferase family protein, partial [Streptomyces klenkii]